MALFTKLKNGSVIFVVKFNRDQKTFYGYNVASVKFKMKNYSFKKIPDPTNPTIGLASIEEIRKLFDNTPYQKRFDGVNLKSEEKLIVARHGAIEKLLLSMKHTLKFMETAVVTSDKFKDYTFKEV